MMDKFNIPLLDLRKQHRLIKDELVNVLLQCIEKGDFIQGDEVRLFEKQLEDLLEIPYVISCGNGTDALQIALMAFDFNPGDEVILPAFSYVATLEVIQLLGLKPVFVDVEPDTFFMSLSSLREAITPKTVAVMPVHLFGHSGKIEELIQIALVNGLKIIEDNAQSLGSKATLADGSKKFLGTLGHIGTTSFFPSKNLGALGDGGALFTDDPDLAQKIRMIANHGQKRKYHHELIGVNSRLDTLQAAFLRIKLRYLHVSLVGRKLVAARYQHALCHTPQIKLPIQKPNVEHTYNQYTIRVLDGQRDALKRRLQELGIASMVYYPIPLHLQVGYQHLKYHEGDFPVSEHLASEVLSLPIDPFLSEEDQDRIISAILQFFENSKA
jgi:UDP-2-acetamido-2-deoxy-ribo-hexuluronate aminotransferase